MSDLNSEMMAANNGAPLPNGFPDDTAHLARLMRTNPAVKLAFFALGGWDTHANQRQPRPAGQPSEAARRRAWPHWPTAWARRSDTVVVVMSEFGRTVRQNGNGGTDHGHGNVMWVMGGHVAGGKVHGPWPGLEHRHSTKAATSP